jgi:hypothetical protein
VECVLDACSMRARCVLECSKHRFGHNRKSTVLAMAADSAGKQHTTHTHAHTLVSAEQHAVATANRIRGVAWRDVAWHGTAR